MPRSLEGMAIGFLIACTIMGFILGLGGISVHGIDTALAMTGRWSFLLFWPAYVGSALPCGPVFDSRNFGLAFAAAHLVHVGLVVCLYRLAPQPPVSQSVLIFFAIAVFWTYLLAACSIPQVARRLPRLTRRLLFTIGMNYILLAFMRDFVLGTLAVHSVKSVIEYLPFTVLGGLAPVLRISSFVMAMPNAG